MSTPDNALVELLTRQRDEARRAVVVLWDALDEYGRHKPRCRIKANPMLPIVACGCGLGDITTSYPRPPREWEK